jgi:hypothetical protein
MGRGGDLTIITLLLLIEKDFVCHKGYMGYIVGVLG